jgi:hypothetical protein
MWCNMWLSYVMYIAIVYLRNRSYFKIDALYKQLFAIIVSNKTRFFECHVLKCAVLKLKIIFRPCNSRVSIV